MVGLWESAVPEQQFKIKVKVRILMPDSISD
jgi:hypothetical protein